MGPGTLTTIEESARTKPIARAGGSVGRGTTIGPGTGSKPRVFSASEANSPNQRNFLTPSSFKTPIWEISRRRTNPISGARGRGPGRSHEAPSLRPDGPNIGANEPKSAGSLGGVRLSSIGGTIYDSGRGGRAAQWSGSCFALVRGRGLQRF